MAIQDLEPKSRTSRVIEGMAIWGSYYRENIDIFIKEYLEIDWLKWFQYAALAELNKCRTFMMIASRGIGKTFLIAIFIVVRCILYPGTKVAITSSVRSQTLVIIEKIQTELMSVSPNLCNEIDLQASRFAGDNVKIMFKNGSYIKVVTAADSARGNRANILVVDEFRMVKRDTIDTVLRKFLTVRRMPPYKALTKDERKVEYGKEANKTCFLSSAFFKDHWSYNRMLDIFKIMLDDTKTDFVCGLPYELAIQEGLLYPEDVESEMLEADYSEIKWNMEMQAEWFGMSEDSFFNFDSISKNRHIRYPMLPEKLSVIVGDNQKIKIPIKQNGEKRILSADIALMSSKKHDNDASAIFINQMLPGRNGRYVNNIVYTESYEGKHTEDQALIIRKLFDEYDCDYIVLDCSGVGLGVYDALVRDMTDPDTGIVYPPISCCNNQEMADRCVAKDAEKVIWAVKASLSFNSDCAFLLREGFRSGKIRLLVTEYDGDTLLSDIKEYNRLSQSEKIKLQMPYINTTLLIDELIKLQHDEVNGKIRVHEKTGMRKDRYSSLSYNYYVALQIENKVMRHDARSDRASDAFIIKPPKSAIGRW